jgi:YVTN family beta-propeller protein
MFSIIRLRLVRLLLAASAIVLISGIAFAGPKAYVGNFKDNTVSAIDTTTGKAVATIPVAAGPHGMGVTSDGRWLYVTSDGASTLSVIDTATDRVARTIEVGKSPNGLALTPDGRLLMVCVYGEDRIAFVDTATQTVVGTVAVAKPHTVSIRPDGRVAYVTSQEPGHFALVVIDLTARKVIRTIPLDKPPRDLEFGYDGKAVYFTKAGVNAVEVLDPASDKIVAEVPTGVSPHYVNFFRNTTLGMVVVQGPGELLLFDPATNKPVRSIAVGKQPHWLAMLGDGKTAYVTNEGSNDVSVVDLANGKTTTIPVGNQPRKVIVQPVTPATSGAKVSIANFAFIPPVVTIAPGDSVTWGNDDGAPHAVAFKDGAPGSDSLLPGKTFRRTFERPGSYDYFCSIHPFMTGRVVVLPK